MRAPDAGGGSRLSTKSADYIPVIGRFDLEFGDRRPRRVSSLFTLHSFFTRHCVDCVVAIIYKQLNERESMNLIINGDRVEFLDFMRGGE